MLGHVRSAMPRVCILGFQKLVQISNFMLLVQLCLQKELPNIHTESLKTKNSYISTAVRILENVLF